MRVEITPHALIVALLLTAMAPAAKSQTCGDCNGDGSVNILDALFAAQMSATIIPFPAPHCFEQFSLCNVTGVTCPDPTAEITIIDALVLAQFAAALPVVLDCGTPLGQPPSCVILSPAGGTVAGDVDVFFDLIDPDTPSVGVSFRYSTDGGMNYTPATPAATSPMPFDINPTASAPGTNFLFVWDSVTDLGVGMTNVIFKIATDDGMNSVNCFSPPFVIDNQCWTACAGQGVSALMNPGFETGSMAGWSPGAFSIDNRAHDCAWAAATIGNNPLVQVFQAVPCSQITELTYWAMHPNENVFGVTELYYESGGSEYIIHGNWMAWTKFDLIGYLDPIQHLVEIRCWGYSGGGPGVDETVFDSFQICWTP